MTPDTSISTTPQVAEGSTPIAMAFVADDETLGTVRKCFIDLALIDARVERAGIDEAISALARGPSPRLLIVDVSGAADPLAKLHQLAEVCDPSTGVVVVGQRNDIVLYRDLKRAGVMEYFFKPVVPALLARTCRARLTGVGEVAASSIGKLVVVFGVRGGVGSSTIAVNTSWHLAEELKRHVALLDLDLQSGDVALQLDVEPSHALREALEHPERVDDLLLARAVTKVTERLGVLASLEPFKDAFLADVDATLKLIGRLQLRHRYVFVDVPHWAGARFERLMSEANILLLVGDSTLASAREMVRWREQMQATRPDHAIWLILNKAGAPGALPEDDFTRAIGEPPGAVVRFHFLHRQIGQSRPSRFAQMPNAAARPIAPVPKPRGEAEHPAQSFLSRMFS